MSKWLAVLTVLLGADALAWNCKYEKSLDQSLDVSGSDSLAIAAVAGDLEITGVSGGGEVAIRGTACASKEEWLDEIRIETEQGQQAGISVKLPETDNGWSIWGNRYVYVDLVLEVPRDLPLDIRDSSGDTEISDVASVTVKDSTGDLDIDGATGAVEIRDTSGDITLRHLGGDLTIVSDSSGDIDGKDIEGSVLIVADSSGGIRLNGVGRDVTVERDSSGDIRVAEVGGDFTVLKDGSGDIRAVDVDGEVDIPDRKR